jgi:MFS family permease
MLIAVCAAAVVQVVTIPLVAVLADRYGRRPLLLAGAVLAVLEAFPFFWLLDTGDPLAILVAMLIAIPLVHSLTYAPMGSFLSELFETRLRYSGSAISYQIGSMVWSGPVPFVAAALFAWAGSAWPLALYMIIPSALSFVAVLVARESYRDDIGATPTAAGDAGARGTATVS